jgi:hypothetical protein
LSQVCLEKVVMCRLKNLSPVDGSDGNERRQKEVVGIYISGIHWMIINLK